MVSKVVEKKIKTLFWRGHSYAVIQYLLEVYGDAKITVRMIKRVLKKYGLKRRCIQSSILMEAVQALHVSDCIAVCVIHTTTLV